MNKRLSSIGFKNIITPMQFKNLKSDIVSNPSGRYYLSVAGGDNYIEFYKEYGEKIGLTVKGTVDDNNNIKIEKLSAFAGPFNHLNVLEASVEYLDEENDYYVVCEDAENGNQIVFYLQNVYEYKKLSDDFNIDRVFIAGLSDFGKIILPIKKEEGYSELKEQFKRDRRDIIKKSREGDMASFKELLNDMDEITSIILDRIKDEDLLSVIEGYIMPYDDDYAMYSILGDIVAVRSMRNSHSNETVWGLSVNVTGTCFDVFISVGDLIGVPSVGMRFMGVCWLQGFI